jgi:hypothetical protein
MKPIPDGRPWLPDRSIPKQVDNQPFLGAYCIDKLAGHSPFNELRYTIYPNRGLVRMHGGDSPEESWGWTQSSARAADWKPIAAGHGFTAIQPSNAHLRRKLRRGRP